MKIGFGSAEISSESRRTILLSDADTRPHEVKHTDDGWIVSLPGGNL